MALLTNLFPTCSDYSDLVWKYTDKPATFAKFTQFVYPPNKIPAVEEPVHVVIETKDVLVKNEPIHQPTLPETVPKPDTVKPAKQSRRQLPMQVIIQLSENVPINTDYIKTSLIEFISKKDFQKVFGVKKTAEVMKGITENKWNKSLVLFLSFMYDTAFVYLNKDVVYNSEHTYDKKIII